MTLFSPPYGRAVTKTLRVVKLTAFIILIACLQVSARGYGQRVTLQVHHASLESVLAEIQKQTGYNFVYAKIELENTRPVDLNVHEAELLQVLAQCFKDQPLAYTIEDQYVVVKKKSVAPSIQKSVGDSSKPRGIDAKGRVVDEKGEVLAGASVEMRNGKKSTLTDAKGVFELKNVPVGVVLVISYTGYQKKEIEVNEADLKTVVLAIANNQLDQAQVIAYGTTTERLNTGNVTTVNAKEIEEQPVTNPLLALEGRVPGLYIVQGNGMPGSSVTVNIQGQNSIQNGNTPFYVVDGVPYSSQALQGLSPANGNPLDFINPSDIESISVLKDADATAIYGSRAANGAILITTKKGRIGQAKLGFNFQDGWSAITKMMPVLNTQQYIQMRLEAINNDGLTIQPSDYDINGTWDTTRNINWQKTLIANMARYLNLNADISGGNASTQYFVGATYNRQAPPFPGDFVDQKGALHFNLVTTSSNKKFRLTLNGNYLAEDNQLPGTDLTYTAYTLAPDNPPLLNNDGSLNWALDQNGNSTLVNSNNPLSYTLNQYTNKNNNLVSSVVLSYQILPGLEVMSNFGYTNQQVNEILTTPLLSFPPAIRPYLPGGFASYQYNSQYSWIIEPQAKYNKYIGRAKIQALVGSTIQENSSNTLQLGGSGYNSDLLLQDPQAAATITVSGSTNSVYKYNAAFSRLTLNWDDRYLLNLTGRRDGSSRFGSANEFHDFWSMGAGWIFSNEKVFRNNLPWLSFGKLKASYGTTGSDQIGDYKFLSLYQPYGNLPYQGIAPIAPNGLTNPYLQWEETEKLELGIDLGFLKDRILFNGTYVRNRSSNELLGYNLPSITGFNSIARNFPAEVQNTEGEFALNTVNIKTKNFKWATHLNITIPSNKLVSFPNLVSSPYASLLMIGKPITGFFRVYHFIGVNDSTGVYQFTDAKGNSTYNPQYGIDNNVPVSTLPKYYGGIQNTLNYKEFEIDLFFNFVKHIGTNYRFGSYPGPLNNGNQPIYVLDRWRMPGDHATIQRFNTTYAYQTQFQDAEQSNAAYTDASFVRLKNVAFSYTLPRAFRSKYSLEDFKIYVQGQNLLTITKFKGMDPELPTGGFGGLPPLRVLTVGIKMSF